MPEWSATNWHLIMTSQISEISRDHVETGAKIQKYEYTYAKESCLKCRQNSTNKVKCREVSVINFSVTDLIR